MRQQRGLFSQGDRTTIDADSGAVVHQVWTFAELNLSVWAANDNSNRTAPMPTTSQTDYMYGPYATGRPGRPRSGS